MYKVLVFGMTENPGGVESVIMNYYRHMDRDKIQFDFLCNSYEKIAYEDELLLMGAKTIHFPGRSKNFFSYRKKLNDFFRNHANEYAAIWVNVCSLANIDYLVLAKKYGIHKRIIHCHNSQNMDSRLREILHKYNRKRLKDYATDFWTCSMDAAAWFYEDSLIDKVVMINNAIDVDAMSYDELLGRKVRQQLGYSDDIYLIGNIGRLHFQKNQKFAIDVFAKISELLPQARLVLIGQGEDREALQKQIDCLKLSDKVELVGVQTNIRDWLSAFDLFLFPSLFEGLSIVALEAQANGVPTLASKGVIPEIIRINGNFTFYDLSLSAEEWAKKILEMYNCSQRERADIIGEKFKQHGFDIMYEAEKLEQLLIEKTYTGEEI